MKKKAVTLDDIAKHTGVSKFSVSRALADKSGVSEDTRQQVLLAAQELGYHYKKTTKNLQKLYRVLLFIPYGDASDPEFWLETINGAESEAANLAIDFSIKAFNVHTPIQDLSLDNIDGIIIAGSAAKKAATPFIDNGIPATIISHVNPLEPLDAVSIADYEGGAGVAKHLLELGHRKFAFVVGRMYKPSFKQRFLGFKETVNASGAEFNLIEVDPNEMGLSFEEECLSLISSENLPTAIFCSTDTMAMAIIWALSRLGISVPHDVSVVGFNNSHHAKQSVPKLTSVDVPKFEIGKRTIRDLYERMSGSRTISTRTQFIPSLVIRESTAKVKSKHVGA